MQVAGDRPETRNEFKKAGRTSVKRGLSYFKGIEISPKLASQPTTKEANNWHFLFALCNMNLGGEAAEMPLRR